MKLNKLSFALIMMVFVIFTLLLHKGGNAITGYAAYDDITGYAVPEIKVVTGKFAARPNFKVELGYDPKADFEFVKQSYGKLLQDVAICELGNNELKDCVEQYIEDLGCPASVSYTGDLADEDYRKIVDWLRNSLKDIQKQMFNADYPNAGTDPSRTQLLEGVVTNIVESGKSKGVNPCAVHGIIMRESGYSKKEGEAHDASGAYGGPGGTENRLISDIPTKLLAKKDILKKMFPEMAEEELLKFAVLAYNAGEGLVEAMIKTVYPDTNGKDVVYSKDQITPQIFYKFVEMKGLGYTGTYSPKWCLQRVKELNLEGWQEVGEDEKKAQDLYYKYKVKNEMLGILIRDGKDIGRGPYVDYVYAEMQKCANGAGVSGSVMQTGESKVEVKGSNIADSSCSWKMDAECDSSSFASELAEFYILCSGSKDENCICKHNFENDGSVSLVKIDSVQRKAVKFESDGFVMEYDVIGPSLLRGKISDNSYNVKLEDRLPISFSEKQFSIGEKKSDELVLYKGETNSVDIILDKSSYEGQNIHECAVDKRTFKLCFTDNKAKLRTFDNGKFVESFPEYKFAVFFPDSVPPARPVFDVEDAKKAENMVIVSWAKNKESDLSHYNLYYILEGRDVAEMELHDGTKEAEESGIYRIKLDPKKAEQYESFAFAEDKKGYFGAKAGVLGKVELKDGLFVYDKTSDEYHYFIGKLGDIVLKDINLPNVANKIVAGLSAVDIYKNEWGDLESAKVEPVDDLFPGKVELIDMIPAPAVVTLEWGVPKNEDESEMEDLDSFKINGVIVSKEQAGCNSYDCRYIITGLAEGEHSFSIIAVDKAKNEGEALNTPSEYVPGVMI